MTTDALTLISQNLSISVKQVSAVIKLLEDGATIPFIARYRKEASGGLDETEISKIQSELKRITDLIKRRESILNTIREQGKLTDELERQINSTWQMNDLEDIYLPYKPKRKTRAAAAIEKGLEPLAQLIFAQNGQLTNTLVEQYVSDQVPDSEAAINGAKDIIAEWINEDITVRNTIRNQFEHHAIIQSTLIEKKRDEAEKYRDYFDFSEQLKR
ncbi:MAG: RNA-binding transcriptional accessory protein, partial [Calditrichaeota bacterium]|nr:RNA-binding transcriptional accessory protein [Calditrichota bacterium]